MKSEKIKQIINVALKSVEDIKDQKLKDKTYEILLNNLISKENKLDQNTQEKKIRKIKKEGINNKAELMDPTSKIAKKFGVDREKIADYFEFGEDNIEILCSISMESAIEEHIMFTLIILSLRKIAFSSRELDSSRLREAARLKGIKSLVNLSTNLKKYPEYIIHKHGKIGCTNSSYKLTLEGLNKGTEAIRNILNDKKFIEGNSKKVVKRKSKSSKLKKELFKLFDEGFFDNYKTAMDVRKELRKRGFFNRRQDIDSCVRNVLMKTKKILIRKKINGKWNYIEKK